MAMKKIELAVGIGRLGKVSKAGNPLNKCVK
jgi:hypothetical protein